MRYFHVFANEDATKSIRGEVLADIDPRTVDTLPEAVQEFVARHIGEQPGDCEPVLDLMRGCRNAGPNESIVSEIEIGDLPGGPEALVRWDPRGEDADGTVDQIAKEVLWVLEERASRKGFDLAKGRAAELLEDGHSLEERCEFLNEENRRETLVEG